jgi:hypothetical protein
VEETGNHPREAGQGALRLQGPDDVQALGLDAYPLTQEALDQASRTVAGWPSLGPQQWEGVAAALGLRLRDDGQSIS